MATKATKQTKFRWADIEDNEAEDLTYLLPPKEVIGPDKNGIKKERIFDRRSCAKFGSAMGDEVDNSRLTMVSTEEISLERREFLKIGHS
ncbi:hypothetical protein GOBAR_AA01658 [Gossypium barbadense]|uniref:Uncharacterized protein n=1 Tax=Gossypium barbadense TaxID=3634 RepID=A0A2P5YTM3_GOSBA|nr:hypothetical protein GOBAR_AA01658 [Gossypium barbadense]